VKALTCFIVAMSACALGTPALAAVVTPIEGAVQVNTGSGFRTVRGAVDVAPGTSVMVSPNGRGEVRYSDGCTRAILPGSVAVVTAVSPCAQGQDFAAYAVGGAFAAAVGTGIYEGLHNANPAPASP
jgi:hypothetical protein